MYLLILSNVQFCQNCFSWKKLPTVARTCSDADLFWKQIRHLYRIPIMMRMMIIISIIIKKNIN